ncbi:MAG TPA: GNAT family N-acetyltransferase [Geminicoccaceae bacterium]|nr:GNAT family N-acetyltransferase [Geminicoccaceae bacterium]
MTEGVLIREGSAADADGVAFLHWQGWRTTYGGIMPEALIQARPLERRRREWRERLGADLETLWVAEDATGRLVGFLRAEPARPVPAGEPACDVEITYLYVDPAWQGRGVGRRLLAAFGRQARAHGRRRVLVIAFKGNPFAGFYAAMGARLACEEPFLFEGWAGHDLYFVWDDVEALIRAAERP